MYALSSFPSTTPLCSSTQLITIIIPYSLLRYLAPHNSPKSAWRRPKIKKWLIEYLAVVRLKERNADKEAAGTTVTREGLLNELKRPPYRWRLTHMLHFQWCARPFDDSFAICSSSQTSLTEVFGPGLVQALCKTSCIDPVIIFDKDDKIGQSDIHWNPFAAVLEVLDLWGEAFGWWIGNEDCLGEEGVVLMMVMMMSRMVVRVNVNANRIRLRDAVLCWLEAGYKLSRGCMTSRNL